MRRSAADFHPPHPARNRWIPAGFLRFALRRGRLRDDNPHVNRSLQSQPSESVRISEVLAALSFALDLTEGQPLGHSLRTGLIGLELANRLDLSLFDRRDLYYALLLKDAGCSSSSARLFELFGGNQRLVQHELARLDWGNYFKAARYCLEHAAPDATWWSRARRAAGLARVGHRAAGELVETRCRRSAEIVTMLGFGPRAAEAVGSLEEHWDGSGHPRGLSGQEIPMLSRILCLAQMLEVTAAASGPRAAVDFARRRSGRWFDPVLVKACAGLEPLLGEWRTLDENELRDAVREAEPGGAALLAGPGAMDRIARGFAEVVDAKSPFTSQHSVRMAEVSVRIAGQLGFDHAGRGQVLRAALLHDIGKLSVPNSILDKPGPLTAGEWETVRMHPYYTLRILGHIRGFESLAEIAASHHERLDGRGYFRGLRGEEIPLEAQILATADIYDALTTSRPYRPALPEDVALRLMERDRGHGLMGECLDALAAVTTGEPDTELRAAA